MRDVGDDDPVGGHTRVEVVDCQRLEARGQLIGRQDDDNGGIVKAALFFRL